MSGKASAFTTAGIGTSLARDRWRPWRLEVEAVLQQLRGERVLYLPNPGNGGDSLIAAATYQAFERAGVEFELASLDADVTGRVVILSGGGNLVPYYDDVSCALDRFADKAGRLILLPHTVRGHEDLLARLDGRCTLFVRDRASLAHVKRLNAAVDVRLAHDMAFHLDVSSFMGQADLQRRGQPVVEAKLRQVGLTIQSFREWPSVELMRLDIESIVAEPASDADISDLFMMGVNPDEAPLAAWCFLHAISLANHVLTDRLHVGIGAALMRVPCTMRDNAYGKNAAVFDYSLTGVPHIRMIQANPRETILARRQRREIETLQESLEQAQARYRGVEQDLAQANAQTSAARIRCEQLADDNTALEARSADLARQFDALRHELDATVANCDSLRQRCDDLSGSNAMLSQLLVDQDEIRARLDELCSRHAVLLERSEKELRQIERAASAERVRHREERDAMLEEIAKGRIADDRLNAILSSRSWRLTEPLRAMCRRS